jgi:hypothetical protein
MENSVKISMVIKSHLSDIIQEASSIQSSPEEMSKRIIARANFLKHLIHFNPDTREEITDTELDQLFDKSNL